MIADEGETVAPNLRCTRTIGTKAAGSPEEHFYKTYPIPAQVTLIQPLQYPTLQHEPRIRGFAAQNCKMEGSTRIPYLSQLLKVLLSF